MKNIGLICILLSLAPGLAHAQFGGRSVSLPTTGIQGSAGIGFTDFSVESPTADFKLDRGTYIAASVERGFEVFHLYLTLNLSHLSATGSANYNYTNLSSTTTYTASDVNIAMKMYDLSIGLKWKIIDGYWFRPYIEGGGLGGYHEVSYTSKSAEIQAQGNDAKTKDVIMGSGIYAEGGIEVQFSDRFGVKIAARKSEYKSKNLETLGNRPLDLSYETYYLAGLLGF